MKPLLEYYEAGGPLMIPLLTLCFAIWLWIAVLYPKLRRAVSGWWGVQERMHGLDTARAVQVVQAWAVKQPGPLGRAAEFALAGRLDPGAICRRLNEGRLAEIPPLKRELALLKTMVAAAPLLGLLGTVKGMIGTFAVLSSRGTASMELLSTGISEALVTTQVGLVVALPGFVGVYAIGRRINVLETTFDCMESHFMAAISRRPEPTAPEKKGGAP